MTTFNLADYPEATTLPDWLSLSSAWLYHLPMVPLFVRTLQPRSFVELGTHRGDSYMMFCQAVAELHLNTKCTAVDTWEGDDHTGAYGGEIYEELKRTHDPKYGAFSRLHRTYFDTAAQEFLEKSVDILHIDGLHTYDAVKHDYETWLPKMSDRGVILFHDTMMRERDFGVWKLWDEISKGKPCFNVPYGFGLGILAVGKTVPRFFLNFLAGLVTDHRRVLPYFHALGHRIELIRNCMSLAIAAHACQASANQWRETNGDPIRNPTPNYAKANEDPRTFSALTQKDVAQLAEDAIKLRNEVAELRKSKAAHTPA